MAKTAKEAAKWVNKHPDETVARVSSMIPAYKLSLHKNQWLFTFFKHLNPDLHDQFSKLKT